MQKRWVKIGIIAAVIVLLLVLIFGVFKIQNIVLKKIFPIKYSEYVYKYARRV